MHKTKTTTLIKPETEATRIKRLRKQFKDIVSRYEKEEEMTKGDVGFLIALTEESRSW